jgi:hypothetical protein
MTSAGRATVLANEYRLGCGVDLGNSTDQMLILFVDLEQPLVFPVFGTPASTDVGCVFKHRAAPHTLTLAHLLALLDVLDLLQLPSMDLIRPTIILPSLLVLIQRLCHVLRHKPIRVHRSLHLSLGCYIPLSSP